MSDRLLSALSKLLPDADIRVVSERPWFSATFAGVQISLHAALSGVDRIAAADRFSRILTAHEFNMPRHIVADIAVTQQCNNEQIVRLTIDALLLEI